MFGGSGYAERVHLEVPFSGSLLNAMQSVLNKSISNVRIAAEWYFMEVKRYITSTDFKRKLRVNKLPIVNFYLVATVLTDFKNCIHANQISRY